MDTSVLSNFLFIRLPNSYLEILFPPEIWKTPFNFELIHLSVAWKSVFNGVGEKISSNNSTVETKDADSMNQLCNNFLRLYLQDDDEWIKCTC